MSAQLVQHTIGISVGIAATETNQVDGLSFEVGYDFASDVVRAFDQVRHDNAIANPFSSIGAEETTKLKTI